MEEETTNRVRLTEVAHGNSFRDSNVLDDPGKLKCDVVVERDVCWMWRSQPSGAYENGPGFRDGAGVGLAKSPPPSSSSRALKLMTTYWL